ncbi:NAD(P)-binding protein [Hypoxylon sp. NC1633]|nr:NAD(P)-binding protein [Hypoxylon sp. NC1633]
MSKPWILVSPASRGIGYALTRHLLRTTSAPVLATARSDLPSVRASLLDGLNTPPDPRAATHVDQDQDQAASSTSSASARLHMTQVDVTSESTLEAASAKAAALFPPATHDMRLAFALPGILRPEKSPRDVDHDAALRVLRVNVLGPLLLMKWFGEFLPRRGVAMDPGPLWQPSSASSSPSSSAPTPSPSPSPESGHRGEGGKGEEKGHATFLTASARLGSTSDNHLGGWYSYRASKSAVNSLTRTFDLHLRARSADNAIAIAYHPGTVRTELSKAYWDRVRGDKLFSPEYAAERLVDVVRTRGLEHRGRCWDWKGEEVLP